MSEVTPIRPNVAVIAAPKRKPRPTSVTAKAKKVERHIEKARNVIFQAQSIAAVAAAAAVSDVPANKHCTKDVLWVVFDLLDKSAAMLDSAAIGRVLADEHELSHGDIREQ